MDEFEENLKSLPPREPSAALDERIAAALAAAARGEPATEIVRARAGGGVRRARWRAVSLPWAMAAALAMGLVGFAAGRITPSVGASGMIDESPRGAASDAPAVAVHVIFENRPINLFDYTVATDDGLKPTDNIQTSIEPGVSS
jgi:hypothetical protein